MTINTKKTEVIFFGNKAHLKKLDNKTVRYLDTPLKRKDKVKYLGVIFDEKMQWKYQIKNITQKASFKLGKIKAIPSFLTPHTKKMLVNALVMPYFHYCSPAWSNAAPFRLGRMDAIVRCGRCLAGGRGCLLINFHQSIDPFLLKSRGMQYCPLGKTPTY